MSQALVSIIIPVFNRAEYIGETLESVISQDYRNWECIVINDSSYDYIDELMDFYCERDSRIQYFHRPVNRPKGANSCRNYGIEISRGKFLQFLDSDDLLSNDKIGSQVKGLQEKGGDLATCKWGRFLVKHKPKFHENFSSYRDFDSPLELFDALAMSKGYFPNHAYLVNRDLISKAGPWMEYLQVNQDGEFMCRIIANSEKICFSENSFVLYRNSLSASARYSDPERIRDLIYSWKLIEAYLEVRFKKNQLLFLEKAKDNVYEFLKTSPGYITRDAAFFENSLKKENIIRRLYYRRFGRFSENLLLRFYRNFKRKDKE